MYGIVGLVFAYFNFHKGYPGLVSATLTPILGSKAMRGPIGGAIDVLAIIATIALLPNIGVKVALTNPGYPL